MRELLSSLDARLRARGVSASVHIYGGAAIALTLGRDGVTPDIDAAFNNQALSEEADLIAEERGLPKDWLNSSGSGWLPHQSASGPAPATPGLHVTYAQPEHLMAMKMVASRRKDASDMYALAKQLNLIGADAAAYEDILRQAYSGEDELEQHLEVGYDFVDGEASALAARTRAVVEGERMRRQRAAAQQTTPSLNTPTSKVQGLREHLRARWNATQEKRRQRRAAQPPKPIRQPTCGGYTKDGRRCRLAAGHGGNHRSRF